MLTSSMNSATVSLSTDFSNRRRELNHRASPTVVKGECCSIRAPMSNSSKNIPDMQKIRSVFAFLSGCIPMSVCQV